MPNYRRAFVPGGTFFFTIVTEGRRTFLCEDRARSILHDAICDCGLARPFVLEAMVLLPDHAHMMWALPAGDADFSRRIAAVKAVYSRRWLDGGGEERPRSESRQRRRSRGVWQPRFWEHWVRDADDFRRHLDYVHWNPVKHGYVTCPHLWAWSTFPKWVERGVYESDWRCVCDGRMAEPPDFSDLPEIEMETAGE